MDTAVHRWFRKRNLRFNLRKLFVLMLACSIVFAIIGPAIRRLDFEQRLVGAICLAAFFVALFGTLAFRGLAIFWRVRRSGAVLLEVPTVGSYRQVPHPAFAIIGIIILSTLTGLAILAAAWNTRTWQPVSPGLADKYPLLSIMPFFMLFTGWMIATEVSWLWVRKKSFQDLWCENGIVSGPLTFVHWREVQIKSWDEHSGMLTMQVRLATFRILLPEELKQPVMQILHERLPPQAQP